MTQVVDRRLIRRLVSSLGTEEEENRTLDSSLADRFSRTKGISEEKRAKLREFAVTSRWAPTEKAVYRAAKQGRLDKEEIARAKGVPVAHVEAAVRSVAEKLPEFGEYVSELSQFEEEAVELPDDTYVDREWFESLPAEEQQKLLHKGLRHWLNLHLAGRPGKAVEVSIVVVKVPPKFVYSFAKGLR